jgi:hypothetical protein
MLTDKDRDVSDNVKWHAAAALGKMGFKAAIPAFCRALRSTDNLDPRNRWALWRWLDRYPVVREVYTRTRRPCTATEPMATDGCDGPSSGLWTRCRVPSCPRSRPSDERCSGGENGLMALFPITLIQLNPVITAC